MLEIKYCYVCNKNVWRSRVSTQMHSLGNIKPREKIIITIVMNNSNITIIVILLYNYPLKAMKNGKLQGLIHFKQNC